MGSPGIPGEAGKLGPAGPAGLPGAPGVPVRTLSFQHGVCRATVPLIMPIIITNILFKIINISLFSLSGYR